MKPDHVVNWSAPRTPTIMAGGNREYGYRGGYIATRFGVVGLYDQGGSHPMTGMSFIANGREIRMTWNRTFSDRYLKTLANRFAAQHQGGGRG